jgi:hypothetical protein
MFKFEVGRLLPGAAKLARQWAALLLEKVVVIND